MKTPVYFFLSWFLLGSTLFSCDFLEDFERGNGNITTRESDLPEFRRVRVGGNFDVTLVHSQKNRVRVITDENLLAFIETHVENGLLEVIQQKKLISKNKIKVIIEYERLEDLRITGAAMIRNEGFIEEPELTLSMDGAGLVEVKVRTEFLRANLSGAGLVEISGETQELDLNLSGAGSLKAMDLKSRTCQVEVSGIGGAEVYVAENLDARIEGVGGIEYAGNPPNVKTEINGLGKIKPVNRQ